MPSKEREATNGGTFLRKKKVGNVLEDDSVNAMGDLYLAGGFWANSTPLATLSLRPAMAVSISFFSYALALPRGLWAFSAPDGLRGLAVSFDCAKKFTLNLHPREQGEKEGRLRRVQQGPRNSQRRSLWR